MNATTENETTQPITSSSNTVGIRTVSASGVHMTNVHAIAIAQRTRSPRTCRTSAGACQLALAVGEHRLEDVAPGARAEEEFREVKQPKHRAFSSR